MKAPVTAYVIKGNNFYKTCLRKGGTGIPGDVAGHAALGHGNGHVRQRQLPLRQ